MLTKDNLTFGKIAIDLFEYAGLRATKLEWNEIIDAMNKRELVELKTIRTWHDAGTWILDNPRGHTSVVIDDLTAFVASARTAGV